MKLPLALLITALALAACATPDAAPDPAPPAEASGSVRERAEDRAYTATHEVLFGDEHVGYVVVFLEVPEGVEDARAYPPGTWLVEDLSFEWIGFITPKGTSYRFDEWGDAQLAGFGSQASTVAAFFGRTGRPTLRSIHTP